MRRGIVVLAAAALLASPACTGSSEPEGETAPGPRDAIAVWPEDTIAPLERARDRVEDGEDPWRLEAGTTAEEFARAVLGWPRPMIGDAQREGSTESVVVERETGGPAVRVTLAQILAPLWSVVSANGEGESHRPAISVRGQNAEITTGIEPFASATVTVAHGDQTVTEEVPPSGEVRLALGAEPETSGHVLILYLDEAGEVASVFASPLPAGDTAAG
ncbi:MAG TPA: hypothetical protein VIC58_06225 [Actinomycetota bacterium]